MLSTFSHFLLRKIFLQWKMNIRILNKKRWLLHVWIVDDLLAWKTNWNNNEKENVLIHAFATKKKVLCPMWIVKISTICWNIYEEFQQSKKRERKRRRVPKERGNAKKVVSTLFGQSTLIRSCRSMNVGILICARCVCSSRLYFSLVASILSVEKLGKNYWSNLVKQHSSVNEHIFVENIAFFPVHIVSLSWILLAFIYLWSACVSSSSPLCMCLCAIHSTLF